MFNDIKHFLIAQILFFLRVHGIGDIFAADIDEGSSPVIHEGQPGYDYDTFTLDRIEADFEHGTLAVEASSSDDNGTWDAGDLPVEVVYDLLEWLMEHEDTIIEYAEEAREEESEEFPERLRGTLDKLVKDYTAKSEVVMAEYLAWRKVPSGMSYEDAFKIYVEAMKQANGDRFFAIKEDKKIEL